MIVKHSELLYFIKSPTARSDHHAGFWTRLQALSILENEKVWNNSLEESHCLPWWYVSNARLSSDISALLNNHELSTGVYSYSKLFFLFFQRKVNTWGLQIFLCTRELKFCETIFMNFAEYLPEINLFYSISVKQVSKKENLAKMTIIHWWSWSDSPIWFTLASLLQRLYFAANLHVWLPWSLSIFWLSTRQYIDFCQTLKHWIIYADLVLLFHCGEDFLVQELLLIMEISECSLWNV